MKQNFFMLWVKELRAPFLTASVIPVLLGAAIAWSQGIPFSWGLFALTLIGGVLMHAGVNVANDYFDHKSGTDDINVDFVSPFTGGSRMIQEGLLKPRDVLIGSLILLTAASIIGIYLTFIRGYFILLLGIVGIFSGFFYTAPPFRMAHVGLGELLVGLNFGILMTLGSYYVQTGSFNIEPVLASVPVALLITAVLYINQFQDYAADKAVGKNNLVVMLGKKRARIGYVILILTTYIWILVTVILRNISPFTALSLLTVPIAVGAIKTLLANYDRIEELAPANAGTIMLHASLGLILSVAYLLDKLL
ncbi:MAG: 1,4-dihydroxy-2-naphthoate octaprenyltransferase [Candidatus Glassbacteria bacterium]